MHPPLALHKHPHCVEVINQFHKCHQDHPYGKFFGYCNQAKRDLDACLHEEYKIWYNKKVEKMKEKRGII
uniref:COX assembly mitochondrial protein n=1 Tax=Arcella intermedia TaxID=1963864 RepID=A0A6B2LX71_9EUKA